MTPTDKINTALEARGLIPLNFKCAMCGDDFERDECAELCGYDATYSRLQEISCGHVCFNCADEYQECQCGDLFHIDELDDDDNCGECAHEVELERLGQLDIEREVRGMI